MSVSDPNLLVRAACIYVTVVLTIAVWLWRRPTGRDIAGAALAFSWNLVAVLVLQAAASQLRWWQFDARGGLLLGMPVEMYLSWAWLWGALPALAFPRVPLFDIFLLCLLFDMTFMPLATPVLLPGSTWLIGELSGLILGLLPAQLLARWTARNEHLAARATLQMWTFAGLLFFLIPAVVIESTGTPWLDPLALPAWQLSIAVNILAVPAVIGVSAVQEFVTRGIGTPVPFDPPARLVTTGVYAYVRNPMQLAGVVLLLLWGAVLRNYWMAVAGLIAHTYALGVAGWDEDEDLRRRFGQDWLAYRRTVRAWLPRFRPSWPPGRAPVRLFVSASCESCREVHDWFARRSASQLVIEPAEHHPSRSLTRITYETADGFRDEGIGAVARAFEHIHLGWALVGLILRLPGIRSFVQLLIDASGGERRPLPGSSAEESVQHQRGSASEAEAARP